MPDEIIKEKFNSNVNKVLALLFKHMSDEKYIKDQLKEIFTLVRDLFSNDKKETVISFLLYIMNLTEIDTDYIKKCLDSVSPEGGNLTMTTAMKLRQEGLQEGLIESARKMLENGADISFVLKVTGLPRDKVEKIQKELEERP